MSLPAVDIRIVTFHFWYKFRGSVSFPIVIRSSDTADQIAKLAVATAMTKFENRWPGIRQNKLAVFPVRVLK